MNFEDPDFLKVFDAGGSKLFIPGYEALHRMTVLRLAERVPDSPGFDDASGRLEALHRELWATAGDAVRDDPVGTAPRLYIDSLNAMIDTHTDRLTSLRDRVMLAGSAIALCVLAVYLAVLGRGASTAFVASAVVILILLVSFDLDRPQRGFIHVPSAPLHDVRGSMDLPPAATGP